MTGKRRLPRAKNPGKKYAIPGAVWNRVADRIDIQELTVAAPLRMTQTPGLGTLLECVVPPPAATSEPQYEYQIPQGTAQHKWSWALGPIAHPKIT